MKRKSHLLPLLMLLTLNACESKDTESQEELPSSLNTERTAPQVYLSEADKAVLKRDSIIAANQVRIVGSSIVVDKDLNYLCKISILNPKQLGVMGVELIDFQDAGFGNRATNFILSVKPLQKIKIKVAPKSTSTISFPARNGDTKPQIARIFYVDGTVERTEYDVPQR